MVKRNDMYSRLPRRDFMRRAAVGLVGFPLVGCGAVRSVINDRIPPISNPGGLEGKQFPVPIGLPSVADSRAVVSGVGSFTGPFNDIAPVNQQNQLNFADLSQNLSAEIVFVPAPGAAYPIRITVNELVLAVRLYEAPSKTGSPTREVVFPSISKPDGGLIYDRVGDTNRYRLQNSDQTYMNSVRISGDDAKRLFALLTSVSAAGSATNYVSTSLTVSADASGVDMTSGVLLFTFAKGEARVGI